MPGYWRDSARTPKFYFVDGRAAFPMVLCLLHIRLWTIGIALAATLFFATLDHFGFTPRIFMRWFRNFLGGNRRISMPWWQY
jgi:intracellular multiplication protein IcmT